MRSQLSARCEEGDNNVVPRHRKSKPPTKMERIQEETRRYVNNLTSAFLKKQERIRRQAEEEIKQRERELQDEVDKDTAQRLRDMRYEYSASRGALSNVDVWEKHEEAVDLAETFGDFKALSEPPVALLLDDGRKGVALLSKDQTMDGMRVYFRQVAKLWNTQLLTFVRGKISKGTAT